MRSASSWRTRREEGREPADASWCGMCRRREEGREDAEVKDDSESASSSSTSSQLLARCNVAAAEMVSVRTTLSVRHEPVVG